MCTLVKCASQWTWPVVPNPSFPSVGDKCNTLRHASGSAGTKMWHIIARQSLARRRVCHAARFLCTPAPQPSPRKINWMVAASCVVALTGGAALYFQRHELEVQLQSFADTPRRQQRLGDSIEVYRRQVYDYMSNMDKSSLQFQCQPRDTKVTNDKLQKDIAAALRVGAVPVRILCVPPGYGKSYALCTLFKELKSDGQIAGADIIRCDSHFIDGTVDLEAWFLEHFGISDRHGHSLEDFFVKPEDTPIQDKDLPYYVVLDQLDKVRFHPHFEHFILRLKDIALRHKTIRFLVSTFEPHVAEYIRSMNGSQKIRFVYENRSPPRWTRQMLETHLFEQADYYNCPWMKGASNLKEVLDIAETAGTPEFIIDIVATQSTRPPTTDGSFAFDLDDCKSAAAAIQPNWDAIAKMKKTVLE
eukprot:m.7296 g.7296  ORF g.7296 m.7296 type:complete len:416 (+) comp2736_c0_seq1:1-1248(+)